MSSTVKSIQFLRFVAAYFVVLSHTKTVAAETFFWEIPSFFSELADAGPFGVHLFFVISGFIMMYTSYEKFGNVLNAKYFLLRRAIRIFPVYLICFALYLLFHDLLMNGYDLTLADLIVSAFLFPGYASLVIGPGWTLSFELFFYICFASIMAFSPRTGLYLISSIFVVLVGVGELFKFQGAVGHLVTNSLLLEFLFGAWIAYAVVRGVRVERHVVNAILVLAIFGFSIGQIEGVAKLPSVIRWGVPSALLVAGIVLQEINNDTPRIIQKYSYLGDGSYSLYLLHILILDVLLLITSKTNFNFSLNPIVTIVSMSCLCLVISMYFYWVVERRVLFWLKDFSMRRYASAKQ